MRERRRRAIWLIQSGNGSRCREMGRGSSAVRRIRPAGLRKNRLDAGCLEAFWNQSSMRAGVLDTVLGQPSVALLLAIADAEFQVRVVLVAPAALGADPRAALRRGGETLETLAPRAGRGPSAQAGEERTATEEHPAQHRGDDAGAHVRGAGG